MNRAPCSKRTSADCGIIGRKRERTDIHMDMDSNNHEVLKQYIESQSERV
jgi:hypothetical protein